MRTTRSQAWKKLVWTRSVFVIGLLTLFLSTVTLWWDELFPDLKRPHIATLIHAIRWWYWAILGLAVILALVVEEALKLVNKSEDQLEGYKNKAAHLPNISIILHQVSLARADPTSAYILTILSVRNTGAPSIVDNWSLKLDDYPDQEILRVTVVKDLLWLYEKQSFAFPADDHLQRKTAEEPVPAGGKRVGFILWTARELDVGSFSVTEPPKITVTARDVAGNLITSINKASHRTEGASYYYGLMGSGG